MDNTTNDPNSPVQPIQQAPLSSPDTANNSYGSQQMPMPTTPSSPSAQDVNTYQSMPTGVQTQSPQQVPSPETGGKITLSDLYGPSGLADETSSMASLTQPVGSPAEPPIPNQQVSTPAQQSFTPDSSSLPPAVSQPVPAQPVNTVMPQLYGSPQNQSSQGVPNLPVLQPSNIPTKNMAPQGVNSQPEVAQESSQTSSAADLPLRKHAFQDEEPKTVPAASPPQQPPSKPTEEKPSRINKFFFLRLLFGAIGVGVLVVLLYLGMTLFSSISPSGGGSGKVTLTYWGLWEDPNTMDAVITDFERTHPNVSIDYEKEDPKEYSQRLLTRVQQGNGPDIFTYHSSWLSMVQPILSALPTSVVSKQELEKNFYPVVRNDLVKNGALYGVPFGIDTLSLFVNNKIFQATKAQIPTTWDTFVSVARALTVKDDSGKIKVAGAAMGTFDNITHAPDILATLFMQNGVDVTKMQPASNASDALSFYTSFASGDGNVWDSTLDPSMLAFARGNLAMYFGYSWDIFLIKANNPDLDFSIYPIPHLPGRNTTAASYWVEGVSNKSPHQKEALEFMQFLAQKDTVATLYSEEAKTRLFGEPYARSDLGATLKDNALVYPFVEQAVDAKSTFFAGETDDTSLNGQMNGYLGNAVRSVLGNTSADSAIDTLTQGVLQIEKQYGSG